jgi:hypothetical protein
MAKARIVGRCALVSAAVVTGALTATNAHAVDFSTQSGSVSGSWDTTVSFGTAWRLQSPDCNLIATADGGCGRSPNIDDGNLNYEKGDIFSKAFKAVTELSLNAGDFGAFIRGSFLYDVDVMDGDTRRTPLSHDAKNLVGSYGRLLDAFGYWRFDLGSMPSELRLGRQVVSWGESTFIQGGVNTINHFDVSALRVPGSELKEAFLPQEMAVFNVQFSNRWSAQALYLFDWDDTEPEPAGSFFSTNDFATPGGQRVVLGFGAFSDQGVDFRPLGGPVISDFQQVPRSDSRAPSDQGQFGFNVKLFLPDFNNGTEFGLYFLNYHSRLPVISAHTGTQAGLGNAFGALNAAGAAAQALAGDQPLNSAIALGTALGVQRAAAAGGNLSAAAAQQYATIGANTLLAGGDVTTQASNLATAEFARTSSYYTEFPEDIKMLGLSFNTQLQKTGVALQGEVTYRHDVPLQYDDVELLFASLTPLEGGLASLRGTPLPAACSAGAAATVTRCNQVGVFGLNQDVRGWGLHDTWQVQSTATKSFANIFRASQLVLVAEAAVSYVDGLEDQTTGGPNGRGLRYNAPGTSVSGNTELAGRHFNEVEPADRFATSTSWGYRLAGRLEYPNLIGSWNVLPRISWQHDVNGTSPGPGGAFVEGRYGATVGVGANLQATWDLDVAYSTFGGAGRWNDLNDRDFIAASVKYSF